MKILEKIKNIRNKKILIVILVILLTLISLFSAVGIINNNINNKRKNEELSKFSYDVILFTLNEDYSYTYQVLITVQEVTGIETIKYEVDGKDIELTGNGKNKIAIDYKLLENTDHIFKIKPIGEPERTEILNVSRKYSGEDTYKLVNGVYLNIPFLDDFNSNYTRYMSLTSDDTLTPKNWIYDEEPEDWYDYNKQKWANIYVEAEGVEAYYVWVPRYMYKLDGDAQRSDVKFVDVHNNYIDAQTGETTTFEQLREQGYQLPEAFQFGDPSTLNNGIITTELSGYWISKYQLSELDAFPLNYNMTASTDNIVLSNFTNNVEEKAAKYTYAINGKIVKEAEKLEDYTFRDLTENVTYGINVTALDSKGSILGSMTKLFEPAEVNPPELTGFDPDTTFYVYWDKNGIEHNEVPINRSAPEGWYNYTYSNWANIVTRNNGLETYYVWIPRYQYKLSQTSERADIKFILGTGRNTDVGYQIPEAFWWDKNDDGIEEDDEQLTGYWITKYQLSKEENQARIAAELAAGTDCIHVKDITGTELYREVKGTEIVDGVEQEVINKVDRPLKYEYYLNGDWVKNGNSATEHYTYTGLTVNTTYTINIIARDAGTNEYVGAITKKVTTKDVNEPDLSSFMSNTARNDDNNQKSLRDRTYYVVYDGENISRYVPITENKPDNWYDYSKSQWANIVVTDGEVSGNTITGATSTTYFVWIPRYEYKILQSLNDWTNLDVSNARTDIRFISSNSRDTTPGYQIPEAFWWDKNDDGVEDDGEQLTGYWMSKYQLNE